MVAQKNVAFALKNTIQNLKKKLEDATKDIEWIQNSCQHDWDSIVYDPIAEKPRWKRICNNCYLTEYTEETREVSRVPKFK